MVAEEEVRLIPLLFVQSTNMSFLPPVGYGGGGGYRSGGGGGGYRGGGGYSGGGGY